MTSKGFSRGRVGTLRRSGDDRHLAAAPGAVSRQEPDFQSAPVSPPGGGRISAAEKWLFERLLRRLGNPAIRVVLWDGQQLATTDAPPVAVVRIGDRSALLGLLFNPALGFERRVHRGGLRSRATFSSSSGLSAAASGRRRHRTRRSAPASLSGSRDCTATRSAVRANVHHHYDITEAFYRLWLDEQLVYTGAYFSDPELTLEEAQRAKMDYVCRKLWLRPGEHVVEAGFGWGALARHMARHYGVRVDAYNLSHEQVLYARRRAEAEGLDSLVTFIEDDYRNIAGEFDVFVSVGMLEHVGRRHYRQLGEVIDRCLKPAGRGLVHSIGRDQSAAIDPWIQRRIFPGAYPPTLKEMMDVFQPKGFSVLDVENLRLHYAKTLEHWLNRYEANEQCVADMFDPPFVRMWRLYLAGSVVAFASGTLQLFQVVFTRPGANDIPWSRAWLYEKP